MRITRFLLPGCLLAAFAGPVSAQFGGARGSPYQDLIPSVRPAAAEEPVLQNSSQPQLSGMPPGGAPAASSLQQMTVPQRQPGDPIGTLTGQPALSVPGLPLGSYPSPYYVDGPGCCGPMGRDGRITYEIYDIAGVNFAFGSGLGSHLDAGWTIGGGARTLFFDPTHTRAWTVDLGLTYTHNAANGLKDPLQLDIRQPLIVNAAGNVATAQPDRVARTAIHGIHRLSFNYSFGRDWWLLGSGATGSEETTNVRVGAWVGGRYGTAHVDLVPLDQPNAYSRRQNAWEGVFVGAHAGFDTPLGGWIFFGDLRVEYGYDWLNLIPPVHSNLNNINIQVSAGIRF